MQVFERSDDISRHLSQLRNEGKHIGFVPTMGSLHEGHLALVEHAMSANEVVVVSIFVNPTQFNNPHDLKSYPRDTARDLQMLQDIGCPTVFLPSEQEMYPAGIKAAKVDLNGLDQSMEGLYRPGHFDGVATVVSRFFEILQPHRAYFGEKDYQQLMIIRHMVKAQNMDVEIVPHRVERNVDGLALSSRNMLLKEQDRQKASRIWKSMEWARNHFREFSPAHLEQLLTDRINHGALKVEYVNVVNEEDLQKISAWQEATHARIFVAAYLSEVRLIDNVSLF